MFRLYILLGLIGLTAAGLFGYKCCPLLDCFSMSSPWYQKTVRPIPKPECPDEMSLQIELYTRFMEEMPSIIKIYPEIKMNNIRFDPLKDQTIFIIPGIGDGASWPSKLKSAFLKRVECNVFLVNTTNAFKGIDIFQAVSNARVVGAELARLVKHLKKTRLLDHRRIYFVGYGLGAHVAGYTGKITSLGRITGLDPMQEFFEGFPDEIHLTANDADFVDIIHTDARPMIPDAGAGYMDPLGQVDFYINTAHYQPGCHLPHLLDFKTNGSAPDVVREITKQFTASVSCAHRRAFEVFLESIQSTKCVIWGHNATRENILQGISNSESEGMLTLLTAITSPCTTQNCVAMGLATPQTTLRGSFIVTTNGEPPYCIPSSQSLVLSIGNKLKDGFLKWAYAMFGEISLPLATQGNND